MNNGDHGQSKASTWENCFLFPWTLALAASPERRNPVYDSQSSYNTERLYSDGNSGKEATSGFSEDSSAMTAVNSNLFDNGKLMIDENDRFLGETDLSDSSDCEIGELAVKTSSVPSIRWMVVSVIGAILILASFLGWCYFDGPAKGTSKSDIIIKERPSEDKTQRTSSDDAQEDDNDNIITKTPSTDEAKQENQRQQTSSDDAQRNDKDRTITKRPSTDVEEQRQQTKFASQENCGNGSCNEEEKVQEELLQEELQQELVKQQHLLEELEKKKCKLNARKERLNERKERRRKEDRDTNSQLMDPDKDEEMKKLNQLLINENADERKTDGESREILRKLHEVERESDHQGDELSKVGKKLDDVNERMKDVLKKKNEVNKTIGDLASESEEVEKRKSSLQENVSAAKRATLESQQEVAAKQTFMNELNGKKLNISTNLQEQERKIAAEKGKLDKLEKKLQDVQKLIDDQKNCSLDHMQDGFQDKKNSLAEQLKYHQTQKDVLLLMLSILRSKVKVEKLMGKREEKRAAATNRDPDAQLDSDAQPADSDAQPAAATNRVSLASRFKNVGSALLKSFKNVFTQAKD